MTTQTQTQNKPHRATTQELYANEPKYKLILAYCTLILSLILCLILLCILTYDFYLVVNGSPTIFNHDSSLVYLGFLGVTLLSHYMREVAREARHVNLDLVSYLVMLTGVFSFTLYQFA